MTNVTLSRHWKQAQEEIQQALTDLCASCVQTRIPLDVAQNTWLDTYFNGGVPGACETLVATTMNNKLYMYIPALAEWVLIYTPGATGYEDVTGVIVPFSADLAAVPSGWLLCDGRAVSRSAYASLYAITGDSFGAGDGSTTFQLPDLRYRVPIGVNDSTVPNGANGIFPTAARGAVIGVEELALTLAEYPYHRHGNAPGTRAQVRAGASTLYPLSAAGQTLAIGGDEPHNNLAPALFVNYIIKD